MPAARTSTSLAARHYDDEEYAVGVRGAASAWTNDEKYFIGAICILEPSIRLNLTRLKECG